MKHAQKPDHVSLATLINRLREGRYVMLTWCAVVGAQWCAIF